MVHSASRFIRESREVSRCAYCHSSFDNDHPRACRECDTRLHEECWLEFGRCPNLGCEGVPTLPNKEEQRLMKVRQMARNLHSEALNITDKSAQVELVEDPFFQGPLKFITINFIIAISMHLIFSWLASNPHEQIFIESWYFFFHLLFNFVWLFTWLSRKS